MKIPKKVKIGNETFKIKVKRFMKKNLYGSICQCKKVIKINKNNSTRELEATFFHEIVHGLLKEMSFNYPFLKNKRFDEDFVEEMGLLMRNIYLDLLKKDESSLKEIWEKENE